MRLLVVTSLYPTSDRPGAGLFVAQRVEWLRKTGHEVTVVAARDYRAGAIRRHLSMLRQVIDGRATTIDGVEGHVLFPAGLISAVAARIHRVPLVLYAHGSDVRLSAARSPVHRLLAATAARWAGAVVANSKETANLVRRLGTRADVIPPGVDMERFAPGDRADARRAVGIEGEDTIALFLGRLDVDKGPDLFAEAVMSAPGWLGISVGDGPMAEDLRAKWPGVAYQRAVAHDAVPAWLRAADVVVVPSRAEGLGLAAVEALACGIPVIASRVGGLPEVVEDHVTGLLVEPEDPSSIASALGELADPDVRASFGSRARTSVADHDIRLTTERMEAVWRRLGISA